VEIRPERVGAGAMMAGKVQTTVFLSDRPGTYDPRPEVRPPHSPRWIGPGGDRGPRVVWVRETTKVGYAPAINRSIPPTVSRPERKIRDRRDRSPVAGPGPGVYEGIKPSYA